MFRNVLAAISGYIVMALLVMAGFSVALAAPGFAFRPDSLDVTNGWLAYTLTLSFVAAMAGGFVCAAVARKPQPVLALAIVVLVLGLFEASRNQMKATPARSAEELRSMSMMDKAQISVQPTAYSFALPFVGACGVLAGGRLRGRQRGSTVTAVSTELAMKHT